MNIKLFEKIYREISYQTSRRNIPSIFNYWEFLNRRLYNHTDYMCSNEFYGLEYILARYSGYKKKIRCATEHSVALGDYRNEFETVENSSPVLLTTSKSRAKFLEDVTDKIIIPVSVWTAYAKNNYSEFELDAIKESLGKTLVIFPQHSVYHCKYISDTEGFIRYVNKIKKRFDYDSVLACVYYWDIEHGLHTRYEQAGFTVVTAGRQENFDFLDNLVTILSFADAVISQGYSSAVLYAGYYGIPINIVYEEIKTFGDEESDIKNQHGLGIAEKEVVDSFLDFSEVYSEKQRELIEKIVDRKAIKNANEMRLIFEFTDELMKASCKSRQHIANKKKYITVYSDAFNLDMEKKKES